MRSSFLVIVQHHHIYCVIGLFTYRCIAVLLAHGVITGLFLVPVAMLNNYIFIDTAVFWYYLKCYFFYPVNVESDL